MNRYPLISAFSSQNFTPKHTALPLDYRESKLNSQYEKQKSISEKWLEGNDDFMAEEQPYNSNFPAKKSDFKTFRQSNHTRKKLFESKKSLVSVPVSEKSPQSFAKRVNRGKRRIEKKGLAVCSIDDEEDVMIVDRDSRFLSNVALDYELKEIQSFIDHKRDSKNIKIEDQDSFFERDIYSSREKRQNSIQETMKKSSILSQEEKERKARADMILSNIILLFNSLPPKPISDQQIEKLPKLLFSQPTACPQSTIQCSICLVDFEDREKITQLICLHIFHNECVGEWLKRAGLCPICKDPVDRSISQRQNQRA